MTRDKMPPRRYSETFEFSHRYPNSDPRIFTASAGFYPDGRIGEAFAHAVDGKEKLINVDQHDSAILLSFLLQYGAKLDELGKSMLRGVNGEPHGFIGALIDNLIVLQRDVAAVEIMPPVSEFVSSGDID